MSGDDVPDGRSRAREPEGHAALSKSVVIRADIGRWWTAVLGNTVRCALAFTVIGAVFVIAEHDVAGLAFPLLGAAIGAVLGAIGAVSWLIGPAQTSYEVADGHLIARRRGKIRLRVPAEHITDLSLGEPLTWPAVSIERMFSYSPFEAPSAWINVRTPDRWSLDNGGRGLPSILLWGYERCQDAERQLRQALGLPAKRQDDG